MHGHSSSLRVLGDSTLGLHGPVAALDVSPNGRLLLATTDDLDGDAAVFDLQTLAVVDRARITASAAWFLDDTTFVTAYAMTRWHRVGQRELLRESQGHGVPLAYARGRGLLALTQRPETTIVDVMSPTGSVLHRVATPSAAKSLAFDRDGSRLAIGCETGAVVAHLAEGARVDVVVAEGRNVLVAWAGDELITIDADDRSARVWRGKTPRIAKLESEVERAATSPNGVLALASPAAVIVDPLVRARRTRIVGPIGALAFVGERRIALGVRNKVRFLDVEKGTVEERGHGHDESVEHVATTGGGKLLATAGATRGTIRLWDTVSGGLVHELTGHDGGPSCPSFTREGDLLASGGRDGRLVLHDVRTGERVDATPVGGGFRGIAATFAPDRRIFVVQEDGLVTVHALGALSDAKRLARVQGGGLFPPSIAVDSGCRWVAVGLAGKVTVLHADGESAGREVMVIEGEARLPTFAPDGPLLALRQEHQLLVVEVPTQRVLQRVDVAVIHSIAFLPGGSVAVVPYVDAPAEVIDVATGERRPLSLPSRPRSVASAGLGMIALGFADGTAALCPAPLSAAMQRVVTLDVLRGVLHELLPRDGEARGGYRDVPATASLDGDALSLSRAGARFRITVGADAQGWLLRIEREGRPFVAPVPSLLARARRWVGARPGPGDVAPAVVALGAVASRRAEVEPSGALLVRGADASGNGTSPPPDAPELERWLVALAPAP